MNERIPVMAADVEEAISDLIHELQRRLKQHGDGCFISSHEIRGAIDEEFDEYKEAVHKNDEGTQYQELLDMGVGMLFGVASMVRWRKEREKKAWLGGSPKYYEMYSPAIKEVTGHCNEEGKAHEETLKNGTEFREISKEKFDEANRD